MHEIETKNYNKLRREKEITFDLKIKDYSCQKTNEEITLKLQYNPKEQSLNLGQRKLNLNLKV